MLDNIDDFTQKIGLNTEQSAEVKVYIKTLLVDTLKSMKDEFNDEVNRAIADLETIEVKPEKIK
jgi:hypothetical protein